MPQVFSNLGGATYSPSQRLISLPEELHERLRQEAFRGRMSMAYPIRSRLERTGAADRLSQAEGMVRGGRLSCDVDQALYTR